MKKALIVLLGLCLMVTALAAAPSEDEAAEAAPEAVEKVIDLSGYDDDTLVALLHQVQSEIVDRHIEKTALLRAGTYVFGEDIPAGKYILTKSELAESGGDVYMYAAADLEDPEDTWPSKLYDYISRDEAFDAYIIAEDGDTLMIEFPCDLAISAGVTFQ